MTVSKFLLPMDLQFFAEEPEENKVEPEATPAEPAPTEPVVEEPAPVTEPVAEPVVEADKTADELEDLKKQLAKLQDENAELAGKVAEKDSEVSATTSKVTDYETALSKIVDQRLAAIPETITALMPEGLTVAEKLTWVEKAEQAVPAKEEPDTPAETAKPVIESIGQPTPVQTEVEVDLKDLTASQKLSNYFDEFFGKKL